MIESEKPDCGSSREVTRRDFLARIAGATVASAMFSHGANSDDKPTSQPRSRTQAKSRVVRIEDSRMIPDQVVQRGFLRSYLEDGLAVYGGFPNYERTLHGLFKQDDIILFKFNKSAAKQIGTTDAMTTVLVDLFVRAGYSPDRLMIMEGGEQGEFEGKTKKPDLRWQGKMVKFGRSGEDTFVAALDQATAIVNVPFLKTHHLATMTSCLKNVSHGLIRHPARFHSGGCDPAIGEIVATQQVREKLKLNIVNGLRSVFERGADARPKDIADQGGLLIATDPVAADAIGYGVLNGIREKKGLRPLLAGNRLPKQLLTASSLGLGNYDEAMIAVESL